MISLLRRFRLAVLAGAMCTAFLGVTAQTATAEIAITDVGVAISGPQTAVTNGLDALVKAAVHNDGLLSQANVTMTIATGGKVDTALPLPGNCALTTGATDTVACAYANVPARSTGQTVNIAVTTPASGPKMVSTAAVNGSHIVIGDTDQSASWTTQLSPTAPCGTSCTQAFVPNGHTVSHSDGTVSQVFAVPSDATWTGGGVFVTLDDVNTTTQAINCGGSPCTQDAGESKFTPLNPSATPDPNHPLFESLYYNVFDVCGFNETGDCLPIYFLPTGHSSGTANPVQLCGSNTTSKTSGPVGEGIQTAAPTAPTAGSVVATSDPCLISQGPYYSDDTGRYDIALLKDIILPILRGVAL
jgi:hypothetical protein